MEGSVVETPLVDPQSVKQWSPSITKTSLRSYVKPDIDCVPSIFTKGTNNVIQVTFNDEKAEALLDSGCSGVGGC